MFPDKTKERFLIDVSVPANYKCILKKKKPEKGAKTHYLVIEVELL